MSGSDWRRTPGLGRYARPEIERRFLVEGAVPAGTEVREIEDRYLDGTRLRLRAVRVGEEAVFKLTQKIRADVGDPSAVAITNAYLDADEYAVLARLPAAVLRKTRSIVAVGPVLFAVDRFAGALAGLVLAEVEVEDLGAELVLPPWIGPEVTHDDRYSGGTLARSVSVPVSAPVSAPVID